MPSELWAELRRNLAKQTKGVPLKPSAAFRRLRQETRKADAQASAKFAVDSKNYADQERQFADEMVAAEPPFK
jgi:hypothetical protein